MHRLTLAPSHWGGTALTYADDAGYAQVRPGDTWELVDLRGALERGDAEVTARVMDTGAEITLRATFSPRERTVLLDGGLPSRSCQADSKRARSIDEAKPAAETRGTRFAGP